MITISANRDGQVRDHLLRGELARLAVESRKLREMVSRLEAASSGRIAALEVEIGRMRLEMAERDRRLAKYENPHARPRLVRCTTRSAPPSGR